MCPSRCIGTQKRRVEIVGCQNYAHIKEHARRHDVLIGRTLTRRFGTVPREALNPLRTIENEARLDALAEWAFECPDLDAFRARLTE